MLSGIIKFSLIIYAVFLGMIVADYFNLYYSKAASGILGVIVMIVCYNVTRKILFNILND